VKGNFPSRIRKTDQERIQNLTREWPQLSQLTYEVTEKLEGSSMTVYFLDGEFGVCSRNLDLKRDENNSFWAMAIKLGIEDTLTKRGQNLAIQGELIGPGIQDNIYGLTEHEFHVFDIQNLDTQEYLEPAIRRVLTVMFGLRHSLVIDTKFVPGTRTVAEMLALADGFTAIGTKKDQRREGLVYKEVTSNNPVSWKTVSDAYLLKAKD
jgi:RNA ligase (TIGR02306 family)